MRILFAHQNFPGQYAHLLRHFAADAPLLSYFEYFYGADGLDVGFDPEFPVSVDTRMRVRTLNAVNLLGLGVADRGQCATEWQHGTYPGRYRDMISVVHEGIATDWAKPDLSAALTLADGRTLSAADEVVTYVSRKLEPYRGFHVFMRALPEILRRRPQAHAVIVGADGRGYGRDYPKGGTWRQAMLDEVGGKLDASRVHFLGQVPRETYLKVLQISSAHVYLTYPFVLSWSMLEAMTAGCALIASATPPVKEVVRDGEDGMLVDFFDVEGIAGKVAVALGDRKRMKGMRKRARQTIIERYDVKTVCLPKQIALVESLLRGTGPASESRGRQSRASSGPKSHRAANSSAAASEAH